MDLRNLLTLIIGTTVFFYDISRHSVLADNEDFWSYPVKDMLEHSCSVASFSRLRLSGPIVNHKRLQKLNLRPLINEAVDIANHVLATAEPFLKSILSADKVKVIRLRLNTTVQPRVREDLNNESTLLLDNLLQVVTYAYYVKKSETVLTGKYAGMKRDNHKLFNKLMRIACNLHQAFPRSPLDYVTRDDVPTDLRHLKRGPWDDLVLFVTYERLTEYLNLLLVTYSRSPQVENLK